MDSSFTHAKLSGSWSRTVLTHSTNADLRSIGRPDVEGAPSVADPDDRSRDPSDELEKEAELAVAWTREPVRVGFKVVRIPLNLQFSRAPKARKHDKLVMKNVLCYFVMRKVSALGRKHTFHVLCGLNHMSLHKKRLTAHPQLPILPKPTHAEQRRSEPSCRHACGPHRASACLRRGSAFFLRRRSLFLLRCRRHHDYFPYP